VNHVHFNDLVALEKELLMNKALLKTAVFAAITSFAVTGQAWAHHPSEDTNPNFDFVDEQISDMHIEIVDEMLEDDDSMMNSMRNTGGSLSRTRDSAGSSKSSGPAAGRR